MAADIRKECKLEEVTVGDFFFTYNAWFQLLSKEGDIYICRPQSSQGPFKVFQKYNMTPNNIVYYIKSITNIVPDTLEEIEEHWK